MATSKRTGLENIKRRRQIRARFRGAVRATILNRTVMNELLDEVYIGTNIKRKIAILTRRTKKTGPITAKEKILFQKSIWLRTTEEKKRLVEIVANLKCFEKFPPIVRARLAPHLDYMYVSSGRTVLREGNTPIYVYFVLAGELIAKKKVFDSTKNEYVDKQVNVLLAGDCIGIIAFMEKCNKRPYTVEASVDAELLCIDDDTFNKYLYSHVLRRWNQIRIAISKYDSYFSNWDYMQITFVCRFGEIKEYAPMETIYHRDKGILNFVYFVISGECMILQNLRTIVHKTSNNKKIYLSPSKDILIEPDVEKLTNLDIIKAMKEVPKIISTDLTENFSLSSINSTEENHFVDVGTLSYGAMFGLGESMEDRAIMARTRVQCLLIPRFWLMEREQNPGNMWQRLKFHLNNAIPSREQLFLNFTKNKKWHTYKTDYIKKILDSKKMTGNPTKIDDIPLLCRIIETTYDDDDTD